MAKSEQRRRELMRICTALWDALDDFEMLPETVQAFLIAAMAEEAAEYLTEAEESDARAAAAA